MNAEFTAAQFRNPPKSYRGIPFWAWNSKLDKEVLREQIDRFEDMGMGGFCIHCRIGLDTEYLGAEFMELVRFCNKYGKEKGLLTWLYDEDKWPSGYGAGRVTEVEAYRSRYLLFSRNYYTDGPFCRDCEAPTRLVLDGTIKQLCGYKVRLKDGMLKDYQFLKNGQSIQEPDSQEEMQTWYAYRVVSGSSPWFNHQTYLDTMNPKAVERFLSVTHEVYKANLEAEFSKSIPAIFTDEPQFILKENFVYSEEGLEAGIPYTDDFEKTFRKCYGSSFLENLPKLFWETEDGADYSFRYRYHDHTAERFCSAYCDTIGTWCGRNHLRLTGHVMNEATLQDQTRSVGEAMRAYRSFQIPGIDMLAWRNEYTTVKQAQSVANQKGIEGITSELYGVTNWDFDFRGHKALGDWQAALGVVNRVPHLSWYSMGGESKRDYPASIGGQSPWYKEYGRMETYFARIRMAMEPGRPIVRLGVIHPVESCWLLMGPDDKTKTRREELEQRFQETARWLLFGHLDFDYIAESLLVPQQETLPIFRVGAMRYDVILAAGMCTMRSSTLSILEEFRDRGGEIVFMGDPPLYEDAVKSDRAWELAKRSRCISWEKTRLYEALEDIREIRILDETGQPAAGCIYRLQEDTNERYLFIAPGVPQKVHGLPEEKRRRVLVRGNWKPEILDAMTGTILETDVWQEDGWTGFVWNGFEQDSLLVRMKADIGNIIRTGQRFNRTGKKKHSISFQGLLPQPSAYGVEEENVLVLDCARYRLDQGAWEAREEILRLDDRLRRTLGYPLRTESLPQPWLTEKKPAEHRVSLEFEIWSETETEVRLAAEGSLVGVQWNGEKLHVQTDGWYVDRSIKTYRIGMLVKGRNRLILDMEFGPDENLEWCYLLGNFSVVVTGSVVTVRSWQNQLRYGDITHQGLPFYGGNLWYEAKMDLPGGNLEITIPHYSAPLLTVSVDGGEAQAITVSPYRAAPGRIQAGKHTIRIRIFGNRFNTFGQLHNCNPKEIYYGPKSWRTEGSAWCYEYQLRPVGILTAPCIHVIH